MLHQLDADAYAALGTQAATRFADGLRVALARRRQVTQVGTLTGIFFSDTPVTNYDRPGRPITSGTRRFFHQMLDAGIFLAPSGYETLFVSLSHGDDVIDATIVAAGYG